MATNLTPISPDALLKIVEQVKEYYLEPPAKRQRGRPRTFSGLALGAAFARPELAKLGVCDELPAVLIRL